MKKRGKERKKERRKEWRHEGQKYIIKCVINEINQIKISEAISVLFGLSKTETKRTQEVYYLQA